jgi:hypothetical protein
VEDKLTTSNKSNKGNRDREGPRNYTGTALLCLKFIPESLKKDSVITMKTEE